MTNFRFITGSSATVFMFPGQGSQHVGMAAELAARYPRAQAAFTEANDLLGFDLRTLCFQGPADVLTDTINAQPALLVASTAVLRAVDEALDAAGWDATGWTAQAGANTFVAGHSLGEYSALLAAGSLDFAAALRLVRERGRLMQQAGEQSPGQMAAILGLDEETVAAACAQAAAASGGIAQVANDNCPGQVVISGDRTGMAAALDALQDAGARKIVPLAVSIAAHSPLMAPAAQEFAAAIEATTIHPPMVPVIANTTGQPLTTVDAIRAELRAQLTGSVRWNTSMQTALAAGATRFVEIGAGDVLASMMKRIDRKAARMAVNDPAGVEQLVALLMG
ncbi:MAG: ACP S-malonyltransferase [Caldilineaceae bacterium]|nr:ACP S-malonyltransferase [Caldilineaceae bacterium]